MQMQRDVQTLLTERLRLRQLQENDAAFILLLLNDPDFLKFIGDRGVRNQTDAKSYLQNGPIKSYRENGHGLLLVERRSDGVPMGICGLVRRDGLEAPDLGFALMPEYRVSGFAYEASKAVLDHAFNDLGITRALAVVSPGNASSIRLLERLGMNPVGHIKLQQDDEELQLFELNDAGRSSLETQA